MEQRAVVRFLALKGFKAQETEIDLTTMYGDKVFQISTVEKWQSPFLQRRTELEDDPRSGRPVNSDLAQGIAELIRKRSFLSCKI
jgi:transposase